MISRLSGRVVELAAEHTIIDVNGVGYLVQASTRTLAALPSDQMVTLLTEMVVREDALLLFGFSDAAERDWFRLLTTVQGVGPRVALNLLSALSPAELAAAIAAGDRAMLSRAQGVGARLAVRLTTELRDRAAALPTGAVPLPTTAAPPPADDARAAESALVNLGYRRAEAEAAIARVLRAADAPPPFDALVRGALRELAPR